ncbi:hypothetical protein [Neobacillus citreus]|uniref:DUF2019 domain-containing protein n=1 Tax=Neobacillus citreus TaxID=2833578 RepID=A0A942T318_9BACI|nr:hypothetical protein [Neobacillus citreus]MCH6268886.1 hypothetical protein [Neobacillus citreus]
MKNDELIEEYVSLIIEQGKAFEDANDKLNNKLDSRAEKIFEKISKSNQLKKMIMYLNHENDYVKFAVASKVYSFEPELSKEALKKVADGDSLLKMVVEITLNEINN